MIPGNDRILDLLEVDEKGVYHDTIEYVETLCDFAAGERYVSWWHRTSRRALKFTFVAFVFYLVFVVFAVVLKLLSHGVRLG
jgi:hypothetical protein